MLAPNLSSAVCDVVTVLVLWTGTGHVATQQRDATKLRWQHGRGEIDNARGRARQHDAAGEEKEEGPRQEKRAAKRASMTEQKRTKTREKEFSETRATERYSMSVVSWAPVLLQEAVPSIKGGSQSQVLSVYHERKRQRRRQVARDSRPRGCVARVPSPLEPLTAATLATGVARWQGSGS